VCRFRHSSSSAWVRNTFWVWQIWHWLGQHSSVRTLTSHDMWGGKGKGKAVPLQAWSDPEGSRKLRFPDFMQHCAGFISAESLYMFRASSAHHREQLQVGHHITILGTSSLIWWCDDLPATITPVPGAAVPVFLILPMIGAWRPRHVEWLCRNKTCTVLHQVGVLFDLYYDARKHESKVPRFHDNGTGCW